MRKNSLFASIFFCYLLVMVSGFTMTGCAGKTMSQKEIFSADKVQQMVDESSKEFTPYEILVIPMPYELFYAEGKYGLVHTLYFKNRESSNHPQGDEILGFLSFREDDKPYLLVPIDRKFDINRQFFIGGRVKNGSYKQYGPENGNATIVCGEMARTRFDWNLFPNANEYLVSVENEDSPDNLWVEESFKSMYNLTKNLVIPGKGKKLLEEIGVISSDEVVFLLGTDFHAAFLVFGVKIWNIVEILAGRENLREIYYGTHSVTGYELGERLAPIQRKLDKLENGNSDGGIFTQDIGLEEEWREHKKLTELKQDLVRFEFNCREYGENCKEAKEINNKIKDLN